MAAGELFLAENDAPLEAEGQGEGQVPLDDADDQPQGHLPFAADAHPQGQLPFHADEHPEGQFHPYSPPGQQPSPTSPGHGAHPDSPPPQPSPVPSGADTSCDSEDGGYMPGVGDGGRRKRSFEPWRIKGVDWRRDCEEYDRLARAAIDILLVRAKHSLTQAAVSDIFRIAGALVGGIDAAELPQNFRQMLTFLEDRGFINGDVFVEYDYCKACGTLYRGATKDCGSCQKCGLQRNTQTTGTYVHRYLLHARLWPNAIVSQHLT